MNKKQIWNRKKLIFDRLNLNWSKTHAMVPTALRLNKNIYRIYFGTRNKKNQSSVGFIDYDFEKFKILKKSKKECLTKGDLGTFDDNGVLPSSIIKKGRYYYLFYIGWKPGGTTRYSLIAGLAKSVDKGISFQRVKKTPILSCSNNEPYNILTAPYVLQIKKNKFFMWYVSCKKWLNKDFPIYNIKFAYSENLIDWIQTGKTCIELKKNERAVARPVVIKEKNIYKMWYCYEKIKSKYKIGYAESKNGIDWKRLDENIKIVGKKKYWEKDMMAYPFILNSNAETLMLYNGNNYGETGIGVSILKK